MVPWELLDTAPVPGGGELRFFRRGDEFSIRLGRNELMNSRMSGSEEALARLTCERLVERKAPRLLIGGLGMGFTLRAALAALGPGASVTVAELVPAVVGWARGALAPLFGQSLDDDRVILCETDVGRLIRGGPASYDAILLDVDNGPEALSRPENDRLYDAGGLAAAGAALAPGGVLAIWSAAADHAFTRRLQRCGFSVEEQSVPARGTRGTRHTLWFATRRQARIPA